MPGIHILSSLNVTLVVCFPAVPIRLVRPCLYGLFDEGKASLGSCSRRGESTAMRAHGRFVRLQTKSSRGHSPLVFRGLTPVWKVGRGVRHLVLNP